MPSGQVQAIGKSRSGKPTVTVGGQIYSASQVDLSGLQVGDTIEMDTASSVYNGATVWFLNGYKLLQAAPKYSSPTPMGGQNAVPSPVQTPQAVISEAELRFVSNCVGNAIQAGTIKEPTDIEKWFSAAKNALRNQIG